MSYTFKRLTRQDFKDLALLHNESFAVKHNAEYVIKKYKTDIYNHLPIGNFAIDENKKKIAYCGAFPMHLSFKGRTLNICQSGDTMTHPKDRGKGLFVKLATLSFESAKQDGMAFMFGFTNTQSHPGWKKAGWIFTGKWQIIDVTTGLPNLSPLIRRIPILKRLLFSRLNQYVKTFDQISWQNNQPINVEGFILKDKAFFSYREQYSEAKIIQADKFILFVKLSGNLLIGDVSYFEEKEFPSFLTTLKKLGRKTFSSKVTLQTSKNHWLYSYFNNAGYVINEEQNICSFGYKILTDDPIIDPNLLMHTLADADYF